MPMITDVDTALKDIADWYIKNKRNIPEPELKSILMKHCGTEAEVKKFTSFLETEPGQLRFKKMLRISSWRWRVQEDVEERKERKQMSNPEKQKIFRGPGAYIEYDTETHTYSLAAGEGYWERLNKDDILSKLCWVLSEEREVLKEKQEEVAGIEHAIRFMEGSEVEYGSHS